MSELLSSDILERQFGPTGLEILWQDIDGTARIIATRVLATWQVLELSQVAFKEPGLTEFAAIHHEVLAGESMGKAFRQHNVDFTRQVNAAYRYDQHDLPASFTEQFGSSKPATVIDVSIMAGSHNLHYADILEVYSPEVLWNLHAGEMDPEIVERVRTFGNLLTSFNT